MNRLKKGTAIAAMTATLVGGFEGLRTVAYPDPATKGPPWTVCYGHAEDVKKGDRYTVAECKALLIKDLQKYTNGIEGCVTATLPDERYVALVSFAYNIGISAACHSSVVRLINAGRTRAGCDALMKWNRAAGIVFPGLTRRRKREQALCMQGL